MCLLSQLSNTLLPGPELISGLFFGRCDVLAHFTLMFMKLEFIKSRGSNLESLDVPGLISHNTSLSCFVGLTLKTTGSYSQTTEVCRLSSVGRASDS